MKARRILYLFGCIGLVLVACKKQFEIMQEPPVDGGVQVKQAGWGVQANDKYYSGCITDATFGTGDFPDHSSLVLTGSDQAGNAFRIALDNGGAGINAGNKFAFESGNATMWYQTQGALYTNFSTKASMFSFVVTQFNNNVIEGDFVASLVDSLTNRVVQITAGQLKATIYGGQQCGAVVLPAQADTSKAVVDSTSTPVLAGDYTQNQLLTGANYLTLMLDVQKTGPYTISSPKINGMEFAASGLFVHTGLTTVRVAIVGTPQVVGNTIIPVSLNGVQLYTPQVPVVASSIAMAEYFPVSGGSTCSSYNVNGVYETGSQMLVDNYIEVFVNVTRTGVYSFNTQTVNGIKFTGSGNFTQTGKQLIKLDCVGTPQAAGKTIIPFVMNNITCNFVVDILPG